MMLRGIRTRLLILVAATVVPFMALVGGALWIQWRNDNVEALRGTLVEARLLAAQVDDQISNLENLLAGLSRAVSPDPRQTLVNDATLRRVKGELPNYVSNILVLSLDGENIGTSWQAEGGRHNMGDRDYFRDVVAGRRLAVGTPILGRTTHQWIITIARPVEDQAGHLRAVIAIGIKVAHFQDALRVRELPAGSIVQIVNQHGTVVTRSVDPGDWIGRTDNNDGIARRIARAESSDVVTWPDGVQRITGSARAQRVPWVVSVGIPRAVAVAKIFDRLSWSVGASVAALLAALALALVFSKRIITPVRELSGDAKVLAGGNLAHRTAVHTGDEVGALAHAFNTMAASLERRHRELDMAREAASAEAAKRARLEDKERQAKETLAAVIDASPVAIVCSDTERRIVLWNRAAEQIFGYTAEETLGQRTKLLPPGEVAHSNEMFDRALRGETIRDVEVKRRHKNGSLVDIRLAATAMTKPDGTVWGVAWAYDDITDRKRAEAQLKHLAHYDQLTGLPNRRALLNELSNLLSEKRGGRPTTIALFDLDGFKDVNDTVGHSVGDQLLVEVARRVTRAVDGNGIVCRLGGDEFVVVMADNGDPRLSVQLVDAMLKELARPFVINEHILHIGGSAGLAVAPNDGRTVDELIANADLALYEAKAAGGRTYRFFVPSYRAQAQSRRGLDLELRRAFAENEFELYFQPQVRLADNAVVAAEALLRWRHPTRGLISPAVFVDTLAASAIAPEVGRWILREACEKAAAWRAAGMPLERIGVNLFPSQFRDPGLAREVEQVLHETGLPADMLELEVTESVALNNDDVIAPLQKLHDRGIHLAFDDFGTGYASLSYLTRFPVSRIKIDRNFVAKITDDAEDAAIVRSLIAMGHNLGLAITAEGVETPAQAAFLLREHCEEAQGFLYAKPLPAAEFEAYVRHSRQGPGSDRDGAFDAASLRRLPAAS